MLHEIKVHKDDAGINVESDVIKKITKEKFYGSLRDYRIDLEYLIDAIKDDLNYRAKFNFFLKVVKQNHHIHIFESVLFLEEEGIKSRMILSILNDENMRTLKKEMGEKYKIDISKAISIISFDHLFE